MLAITDDAEAVQVPHLHVLQFYRKELRKAELRGLSRSRKMAGVLLLTLGAVALLLSIGHPIAYPAAILCFAGTVLGYVRASFPDRGVAFRTRITTFDGLTHAVLKDQIARLEEFLDTAGWMSDAQISRLCAVYELRRAERICVFSDVTTSLTMCLGFVISAIVGATIGPAMTANPDAFTRTMVQVAVFVLYAAVVIVMVRLTAPMLDRSFQAYTSILELLRAIQVRARWHPRPTPQPSLAE